MSSHCDVASNLSSHEDLIDADNAEGLTSLDKARTLLGFSSLPKEPPSALISKSPSKLDSFRKKYYQDRRNSRAATEKKVHSKNLAKLWGRIVFQGKFKELQSELEKIPGDAARRQMLCDLRDEQAGGRTLLMSAVRGNQLECASLLLRNGANVNDSGKMGEDGSCLHVAAKQNRHEMVQLLVDSGKYI